MRARVALSGVTKSYHRETAGQTEEAILVLQGLNLEFRPAEICALYGPNGAGKSTLLRIAAQLDRPDTGIARTDPPESRISFVWQSFQDSLFPWLTVAENIALQDKLAGLSEGDVRRRAGEALVALGIELPLEKFASQLSGGQMQMTAIARLLASTPDVAVLDEPFSALDERRRRICMLNMRSFLSDRKSCTILVSHSLDEAILFADRLLVLSPSPMHVLDDIAIPLPTPRKYELVLEQPFIELRMRALRAAASWTT